MDGNERVRNRRRALAVGVGMLLLAAGFLLGAAMRGGGRPEAGAGPVAEEEILFWTCSMHPQVRQDGPGDCPLCGMDLIPVKPGGVVLVGDRKLLMSDEARMLAEVAVSPVERRTVEAEVRMVGKLDYDETLTRTISAWVGGRIDRLYVDSIGVRVREGDHLVRLYSPELFTAQEELILARDQLAELERQGARSESLAAARATLDAVREKLRLWGITPEQIRTLEEGGGRTDHLTIHTSIGGIVIGKLKVQGDYVRTGEPVYRIADLSRLWVQLQTYEADLHALQVGQAVDLEVDAYPGETFEGSITFIHPVLDERTRTVPVRVVVENPSGRLRPGMFVHAVVRPRLDAAGRPTGRELAGAWVCPHHPEVIRWEPGTCEVCGIDLVPAEELGLVPSGPGAGPPLVVPASAVLLTGKRAVVYVEVGSGEEGGTVYVGREVTVGPRAGDYYIVYAGLEEGERVVTNGNFRIDSALQILAQPSMMSPPPGAEGEKMGRIEVPPAFLDRLAPVYDAYFRMGEALATDAYDEARDAAASIRDALDDIEMTLVEGEAHEVWMDLLEGLRRGTDAAAGADPDRLREVFADLSNVAIEIEHRFGHATGTFRLVYCSMRESHNDGRWLQEEGEMVRNPYMDSMPGCGEWLDSFPAVGGNGEPGAPEGEGGHRHE